mgnify:FL=1
MRGVGHATMAAATWAAVSAATPISVALVGANSKVAVIAGGVIAAGAGLWPDLDHPKASPTIALPPLTTGIQKGIAAAGIDHRGATHTLLATGIVAGVVSALSLTAMTVGAFKGFDPLLGVLSFLTMGMVIRVFHLRRSSWEAWVFGLLWALAVVVLVPEVGWWLPAAVGIGYLMHLVGDWLTVGGVAWFAPFSKKRYALGWLGKVGSTREAVLTWVLAAYLVGVTALMVISPLPWLPEGSAVVGWLF